jgi:hypothetical protein
LMRCCATGGEAASMPTDTMNGPKRAIGWPVRQRTIRIAWRDDQHT